MELPDIMDIKIVIDIKSPVSYSISSIRTHVYGHKIGHNTA